MQESKPTVKLQNNKVKLCREIADDTDLDEELRQLVLKRQVSMSGEKATVNQSFVLFARSVFESKKN